MAGLSCAPVAIVPAAGEAAGPPYVGTAPLAPTVQTALIANLPTYSTNPLVFIGLHHRPDQLTLSTAIGTFPILADEESFVLKAGA